MTNTTKFRITLGYMTILCATACGGPIDEPTQVTQGAIARRGGDPGDGDSTAPTRPKPVKPTPDDPLASGQDGVVDQGAGWAQYRVNGSFRDVDTNVDTTLTNHNVMIVRGPSGVNASPLSATAKSALTSDATAAAAASGDAADADMIYFVDRATADQLGTPSPSGAIARASGCNDYYRDIPLEHSYSEPGTLDRTWESGDFIGTLKANASVSGSASVSVRLKVKQGSVLGFCIPYAVGFVNARMMASVTALADMEVTGNFRRDWSYDTELAKPELARYYFMVGYVPVVLGFNLPITAGVKASAWAAATLKGQARADGAFDYTCSIHGCSGDRSFSAGFTPHGDPGALFLDRVQIRPWVQGALRVYLYNDAIVYGQVGVQPGVDVDLFGYAGNTCGDADGDGTNEFVAGNSIDTSLNVKLTAKASAFGSDTSPAEWTLYSAHLGFWRSGDGETPWSPMLRPNGSHFLTASVIAGTRPCWPYADPVSFEVAWGDGATTPITAIPNAYSLSHNFPGRGSYPVSVTLGTDSQGRKLGSSVARNLYVSEVANVDGSRASESR
jgi:hypothetical protein